MNLSTLTSPDKRSPSVTGAVLEPSDMAGVGPLPKVRKPRPVRALGPVDISDLLNTVSRLSENAWTREDTDKPNGFACFHHTQHMIFRFIPANEDARQFVNFASWPIWRPLLLPIMHRAIEPYGFTRPVFPKAMLARLLPGYQIDLHRDGAGANLHVHKIHVPLQTNSETRFLFEDGEHKLDPGMAYEVNNIVRHGGRNGGVDPRIHFIFEVFDAQ